MEAILNGKLSEAGLSSADMALLQYVEKVTHAAWKTTPEDVDLLRKEGWTEDQISEAVYITALFAFFNRVADAFGVPSQNYLDSGLTK